MWRSYRAVVAKLRSRASQRALEAMEPPHRGGLWEYKAVQMVSQSPADAADASRKLGGALSPEALRSQFPEHYGGANGRKQINDFLNVLGNEGWELVQFQQIGELPLMVFKRPKQLQPNSSMIMGEAGISANGVG